MTDRPVAPLVEVPAPLSDMQRRRYARHVRLRGMGEAGQGRLLNARVAVIGAGGLGVVTVTYLAAAGVGQITVIDDDVVETSNLPRQVAFGPADVGLAKAEVLAERAGDAAVDCRINPVVERLTAANAADLLAGHDLVLDGTDNAATRELIDEAAAAANIPVVWGAIHAWYGQVCVLWAHPSDGRAGVRLADLVDLEVWRESELSCATDGVIGPLCGQVGSMMSAEAIKLLVGTGGSDPVGRATLIDSWAGTTTSVRIRPAGSATELGERAGAPDVARAAEPASAAGQVRPLHAVSVDDYVLTDPTSWRLVDIRLDPSPALPQALACGLEALVASAVDGRRVLVVCHNGSRARDAIGVLRERGHDAYYLLGGYLAWSLHA